MKRVVWTLFWILTATVICSAQSTFYFPQIADGVQGGGVTWKTTVFITNPAAVGTASTAVQIDFTTSTGAAFNLQFDGTGFTVNGNSVTMTISGGQTRKLVSRGTGALAVGWARVTSPGNVTGTALFSEFSNGQLFAEAGVPSSGTSTNQAIFVDTTAGFTTAGAYANPNAGPAAITLQLLNSDGVAVMPSTGQALAGFQHNPAFVNQLFPGAPAFTGTMQISSLVPVTAIALRFASTGQFTTLPTISLASIINPAVEWLEQRPWLKPLSSFARILGGLQFRLG